MARPEFPAKPIVGYPNGEHPTNPSTKEQPAFRLLVEIRGSNGTTKLLPFFAPKYPPDPEPMPFPPS